MIIRPILKRSGGYGFDTRTATKGLSVGYVYLRTEDAYYDRKAIFEGSEAQHEYALAKRWRERGDLDAERRLVSSHLRLVAKIAWGYRACDLAFSKLIYRGNRALLDAVKRFDPDSGCRLATYAKPQIHLAIVNFVIESWSDATVGNSAKNMKLFSRLCRLKGELTALTVRTSTEGSEVCRHESRRGAKPSVIRNRGLAPAGASHRKVASMLDQDLAAYVQSRKVDRNKIIVKGRS
jgi:Sigma-70 region 2